MTKYIFYKIHCKDENIKDCYISATVDMDLTVKKHSKRIRKGHQGRLYQCIQNNGGINNWKITPLATYETLYDGESIIRMNTQNGSMERCDKKINCIKVEEKKKDEQK